MLKSLYRDSFIMEASAYGKPALPSDAEFGFVFGMMYEQVYQLCGWEPRLALVTRVLRPGSPPETTACLQLHSTQPAIIGRVQSPEPLPLDGFSNPFGFINTHLREALTWHTALEPVADHSGELVVSPYVVRPLFNGRENELNGDLTRLLAKPFAYSRNKKFIFTEPFVSSSAPDFRKFANAYYAAALGILIPPEAKISQDHLRWLEILHISFQLSWGFPVLAKQKEEAELERLTHSRLQRHSHDLERIRDAAEDFIEKLDELVSGEGHALVGLIEPARLFDGKGLGHLFDYGHDRVWPKTTNIEDGLILQSHDPPIEPLDAQAFKAVVILRILGKSIADTPTRVALIAAAKDATKPQKGDGLRKLLRATLLREDKDGHELLKQICWCPKKEGRSVSFLALATRLLFSRSVPRDSFEVVLVDEHGASVTVTANNLHETAFASSPASGEPWFMTPTFPEVPGVRHIEWITALATLIGSGLQRRAPKDSVSVSRVVIWAGQITEAATGLIYEPITINCEFEGDEDGIERIKKATTGPARRDGQNNLQSSWHDFIQAVTPPAIIGNNMRFSLGNGLTIWFWPSEIPV